MRHVYIADDKEVADFAERAASHFREHEKHWTYTDKEIEPGCLFATKWGLGRDGVLVFKLDDEFEPVILCG